MSHLPMKFAKKNIFFYVTGFDLQSYKHPEEFGSILGVCRAG